MGVHRNENLILQQIIELSYQWEYTVIKFIHTQNHFNKQVGIELVFFKFSSIWKKQMIVELEIKLKL